MNDRRLIENMQMIEYVLKSLEFITINILNLIHFFCLEKTNLRMR